MREERFRFRDRAAPSTTASEEWFRFRDRAAPSTTASEERFRDRATPSTTASEERFRDRAAPSTTASEERFRRSGPTMNMSSGVVRACDESAGSCPSVVNVTSRDVNVTSLLLENGYDVRSWLQLGLCSRPYLQSIQPFWARFPAPPYWYHLAIAACYALILLVGCAGNLFVICVFARHRKLRKPSNLLLLNLAISDLVMVFKSVTIVTNSVFAGPVLGVIGCEFYGFSTGVTGITSIMTLASIAKDRCRAICKPLDLTHQLTRRQAYVNILGVWAYGLLFSVLPLMGVEGIRFTPEGYLTSCSFDYTSDSAANKAFILVFFTAAWILPCCEICRCYYKIFRTVQGTTFERSMEERKDSTWRCSNNRKCKSEIRLARVIGSVVLLWFLSWSPYAAVALMGVFGQQRYITPLITMIPGIFCKTAACLDPFIYSISHPQFRAARYKKPCVSQTVTTGPEQLRLSGLSQ
ncbi:opsin, blue-sensitive-like [Pollicipes pollicipes]|uniref:opsin, blue-sensitive-like n=1 Tax=Pollicipes pollicipes TaxID=41117 RepID=UPI0018854B7D|nr:opsin, blue-sensitive-like [Pollicipes pollicipes]